MNIIRNCWISIQYLFFSTYAHVYVIKCIHGNVYKRVAYPTAISTVKICFSRICHSICHALKSFLKMINSWMVCQWRPICREVFVLISTRHLIADTKYATGWGRLFPSAKLRYHENSLGSTRSVVKHHRSCLSIVLLVYIAAKLYSYFWSKRQLFINRRRICYVKGYHKF